jgi:hypothetical protein
MKKFGIYSCELCGARFHEEPEEESANAAVPFPPTIAHDCDLEALAVLALPELLTAMVSHRLENCSAFGRARLVGEVTIQQ